MVSKYAYANNPLIYWCIQNTLFNNASHLNKLNWNGEYGAKFKLSFYMYLPYRTLCRTLNQMSDKTPNVGYKPDVEYRT